MTIQGAEELEKVLKHLPLQIRKQVISSAVRAGGQVIRKAARRNIRANGSIETGTLYRSIAVKKKRGTNDIYQIGATRDAPHAHLVEFGTGPRSLSRPTPMEIAPGKWATVQTTGSASAKPFMRPAVDENHREVVMKMAERMEKGILKNARELSGKYGSLKKATRKRLARS
jgi:HK97 gp10 family phage protein